MRTAIRPAVPFPSLLDPPPDPYRVPAIDVLPVSPFPGPTPVPPAPPVPSLRPVDGSENG